MSRQLSDQLYIDLGYNVPEEYYTYQAEASSNQTCESTISCDASVIAGGVAVFGSGDLPSFAALNCTISHINGADLFAFSEAALVAQAEVIRETNIELSTQFDVATTAVRGIYVSAQADSFVDVFSAGTRTAGLEAATTAAFSMTVDVGFIQEASCDITAAFTPTLTIDVFKNSFAVLEVPVILNCSIDSLIKELNADINSFVTQTSIVRKISKTNISMFADSSVITELNQYYPQYHWVQNSSLESSYPISYNSDFREGSSGNSVFVPYAYTSGTNYLRLTGVTDLDSSLLVPGTRDFTIEFTYRVPAKTTSWTGTRVGSFAGIYIDLGYNSGFKAKVTVPTSSGTYTFGTLGVYDPSLVTPDHGYRFALVRQGNTFTVYCSGIGDYQWTRLYTGTITGSITGSSYSLYGGYGTSSPQGSYFDDFRLSLGTARYSGGPYVTQSTYPLNKGNLTTVLSHFDGNLSFDTGVYDIPASINSVSTVSAKPLKIKELSSNIQSQGFLVAAAGRIRPFADIEVAAFELTSAANVIRSLDSVQQFEFTQTTEATRNIGIVVIRSDCDTTLTSINSFIGGGNSTLTAFATTLAAFGRIRPEVADLHAAFTVQAQIDAGKIAFADFDVAATLAAEVTKTFGQQLIECPATTSLTALGVAIPSGGVNMPSQFVQSTEGTRVRYNQAAISADTATTADGDVIRHLSGNLSSYSNSEINALRIKQLQAHFDVISSEIAISVKIGDFLIDCAVDTTLTVDAALKQSNSATLESTTNSTVSGDVTKPFAAELEVNAFELAVADSGLIGGADLTVTTELAVLPDVITSASAAVSSTATLVCRLNAVREGIAIEMSFGTMAVSGERTRATESHSAVTTQLAVQPGLVEQLSANLLVEGFVLAIGKVINLQASETYIVPADDYGWIVPKETRSYSIERETRTYIIEGI